MGVYLTEPTLIPPGRTLRFSMGDDVWLGDAPLKYTPFIALKYHVHPMDISADFNKMEIVT